MHCAPSDGCLCVARVVCCSEALEAKLVHLRMQNSDSMKEMEVARRKAQAAQESLQKKGHCNMTAHTHS